MNLERVLEGLISTCDHTVWGVGARRGGGRRGEAHTNHVLQDAQLTEPPREGSIWIIPLIII